MGELVPFVLGAAPFGFLGYHLGAWRQTERYRSIARHMPRESVALATLERLDRESRRDPSGL